MGLIMKQNLGMMGTKVTPKTKCKKPAVPKGVSRSKCQIRGKVKTGGF